MAHHEYIDGIKHYKIYTDGSCSNGTNKILARAGWGVFYATGDQHNWSHPLDGPVQSSSRGELKALLHVVRTTPVHAVVYSDCKSVVDTYNKFIKGDLHSAGHLGEQDLWDDIFHLAQTDHK